MQTHVRRGIIRKTEGSADNIYSFKHIILLIISEKMKGIVSLKINEKQVDRKQEIKGNLKSL